MLSSCVLQLQLRLMKHSNATWTHKLNYAMNQPITSIIFEDPKTGNMIFHSKQKLRRTGKSKRNSKKQPKYKKIMKY